ncbi:MAG: hypothetical protein F4073_04450 [Rhodobacteraceae bacterium]|nr:hypothetical protein [Paracoccaceae bacterium]MYF44961.1 hypothetical protein [Paracoccaceae bacterium]MYI91188.1 hypothetical protein [Paracoccaceae bacterium]
MQFGDDQKIQPPNPKRRLTPCIQPIGGMINPTISKAMAEPESAAAPMHHKMCLIIGASATKAKVTNISPNAKIRPISLKRSVLK